MTFAISNLRVEHYAEPLGIQTPSPRLSWTLVGTRDNWVQKGYEIVIVSAKPLRADGRNVRPSNIIHLPARNPS